jgi:predicted ATPase
VALGRVNEAQGALGEPKAGLEVLKEALAFAETTGERWYEPELYRLKGALLLQQSSDHSTEAEACFHHAISIARSQQAKSRWNSAPLPAWLGSGSSRANARKPMTSWHPCTIGSPRGLIPLT